jgi:FkbM family methyltransferase
MKRAGFDLMLVARQFIAPGSVVWDIGSNQGIFAACAAAKAGPGGLVLALEPDPTYAALQHRTYARFPKSVAPCSVLCAAVSDKIAVAEFSVSSKGHARSGLAAFNQQDVASKKPVVTLTLDFLLDYWPSPAVMKIDVEGADFHVLCGASELLRKVRPTIYIEMTEDTWDRSTSLLRNARYEIQMLHGDGSSSIATGFSPYTIATPNPI